MEIRVAPVTAPAGPGLDLPGPGAGGAGATVAMAGGMPTPGPALGPALGGAQAILAGLNSPLAHAGLLPVIAPTEVVPTSPALASMAESSPAAWAATGAPLLTSAAALGLSSMAAGRTDAPVLGAADPAAAVQPVGVQHASADAVATQPLVPAWVTALHTPPTRLGPWPQPARERQAERAPPDRGHGEEEAPTPPPAGHDDAVHATPGQTEHQAAIGPWPAALDALLPPPVHAELSRRRSVLLVAPPAAGQRGLQLVCLGFDGRGRPVCHRWPARGAAAATPGGARSLSEWQLWRVRREGDDGQRPVLTARALAPGMAAGGLVLRATATVLPPPLRPAHHGWLDVLEPQRLWRDLGSQWTLLLAWSPHPLPLNTP